jgi:hypothetical protein
MKSRTTKQFRALFGELPADVRAEGLKAYGLFPRNPGHPSLHYERIAGSLHSVRITRSYRALGTFDGDRVVWFWAGSHDDYDRLITRWRQG